MIVHSFVKTGILLSLLALAPAVSATAEVISIKHGTFTYRPGILTISGNRGFTMDAGAQTGFFHAFDQCSVPECPPGAVVEINAGWSGNDLPGIATLRGKTYPDLGGHNSPNSAEIRFSGQITMPPMSDGPVSVTVPFDFAGEFRYRPDLETPPEKAFLTGGGVATFHLEPFADGMTWFIRSAEFAFRPVKR
jgi:hypothetical protein